MKELSKENLTAVIKTRLQNSHKGTFGRSVLIGGNDSYGGAIIMSAEACVKAGCGLTSVSTAEKIILHFMLAYLRRWFLIGRSLKNSMI